MRSVPGVKQATGFALAILLSTSMAIAQKPEWRPELDWKFKWHGQTTAVDVISKGKAPQGYHFNNKYNRIAEVPWNAVQSLLGSYFVARVEEAKPRLSFSYQVDRLVAAQCTAVMSMLSSQQSLYEGHVVYQLDDWRPGDPMWQAIWKQPRLADAILKIDRSREAEIRKFLGMSVIPLRSVDNCEKVATSPQLYSSDQDYSDGFEISWSPSSDPKKIKNLIESLQASGLLLERESREISAIMRVFDDGLK